MEYIYIYIYIVILKRDTGTQLFLSCDSSLMGWFKFFKNVLTTYWSNIVTKSIFKRRYVIYILYKSTYTKFRIYYIFSNIYNIK